MPSLHQGHVDLLQQWIPLQLLAAEAHACRWEAAVHQAHIQEGIASRLQVFQGLRSNLWRPRVTATSALLVFSCNNAPHKSAAVLNGLGVVGFDSADRENIVVQILDVFVGLQVLVAGVGEHGLQVFCAAFDREKEQRGAVFAAGDRHDVMSGRHFDYCHVGSWL